MTVSLSRLTSIYANEEVVAKMKVAVAGLGYVGSVSAACLAANGHDVWGVDIDAAKVADICAGRSPIGEPGLDGLIAQTVAEGTLHATTSWPEAITETEVTLICVGTPSTVGGAADLSNLRRVVADVVAALRAARPALRRHEVVIRSTVPPGTIDTVVAPVVAAGLAGSETVAGVAMCPEFLREGSGVADFLAPPLLVAGTSDPAVANTVAGLFGFLGAPVQVVPTRVAEALKYACNAFHATKVSFANEIARLFRLLDVDSRQVMALFCQDQVLNISPNYLRPGFAFGGSCLPKDLRCMLHLGRMGGADLPLLSATLATNELSVTEVVDRVIASDAQAVALFGLSFKTSTDDLRESPNVELAERLIGKGFDVRIYDGEINPSRLVGTNRRFVQSRLPHLARLLVRTPQEALRGADAAVVSVADPDVLGALADAPPRRVIDLSGWLGNEIESLPGYEGLGW